MKKCPSTCSSNKTTKDGYQLAFQFFATWLKAKKNHYKENIVENMKMTPFSFNFIMTDL
jgi:hypothetical protein